MRRDGRPTEEEELALRRSISEAGKAKQIAYFLSSYHFDAIDRYKFEVCPEKLEDYRRGVYNLLLKSDKTKEDAERWRLCNLHDTSLHNSRPCGLPICLECNARHINEKHLEYDDSLRELMNKPTKRPHQLFHLGLTFKPRFHPLDSNSLRVPLDYHSIELALDSGSVQFPSDSSFVYLPPDSSLIDLPLNSNFCDLPFDSPLLRILDSGSFRVPLDSDYVRKMGRCAPIFLNRLLRLKSRPEYDPEAGAVYQLSFLRQLPKRGQATPEFWAKERFPHCHFDIALYSVSVSSRVIEPLWKKVTYEVMGSSSSHVWIEPLRTSRTQLLYDVIKAQQYRNPEMAVEVLKALKTENDKAGKQQWAVRYPQTWGKLCKKGVRH